jgi:peptidyl-prolyl cis-trans isomerase C
VRSFLLFSLLATACGGQAASPAAKAVPGTHEAKGELVLTVGDQKVTQEMVDTITRGFPKAQLDRMKETGQFKDFLEQVAIGQQLYQQAIDDKLHEDPTVQLALALAARDALAKEVIGRIGDEAVTDDKLQAAYDGRKVQYASPQVRARHVLLETKEEAEAVAAELKGGADFAKVAQEKSKDKASGAKGGDLNWFKKGQMVAEFSDAAFGSTGDEIIGPVESKFGFHVLQVTDRRDAIPLEEVKDSLEGQVKQEAIRTFLDDMKKKAEITWADDSMAGGEKKEGGDHDGHGH